MREQPKTLYFIQNLSYYLLVSELYVLLVLNNHLTSRKKKDEKGFGLPA